MTQAWYRVLSSVFSYVSAAAIVLIALLALKKHASDRALWRRVRKSLPQAGSVGVFSVLAGGRRLGAGEEIRVPYEGTMGSSHSCDVCIPVRKVHMRSAFFWMEQDGLHMVALHRDGFLADDVPVEPGDEAILRDGAVLRVGDAKLALKLYGSRRMRSLEDDPYVTTARRGKAQQGKGDGIGAPGRGEERREKKLREKQARKQASKRAQKNEEKKGGKRTRR
ncbi:MAG: hypothetical protein E7321_09765 [Clostridiales bacterium]|nr:hypothetical protein [Clostridiales bacterium]